MKCPKCHYVGYETGDRCKNCGYDFSLLAADPDTPLVDVPLRPDVGRANLEIEARSVMPWAEVDLDLHAAPAERPVVAPSGPVAPALPLFSGDEEPLIKIPPVPRRPVAVRRTPEIPRSQPAARVARGSDVEPRFAFLEQPSAAETPAITPRPPSAIVVPARARRPEEECLTQDPCEARLRATAAAIDVAVLIAIDLLVLYFTLRIAMLTMGDWRLLPVVPLIIFLALLKVGYFSAFAAIGGQSIGKMAAGVRVVTDDGEGLTPGRAIQRSLTAMIAFLTLGAAFAPALTGRRRALHDLVTGTRVIAVPLASERHLAGDTA